MKRSLMWGALVLAANSLCSAPAAAQASVAANVGLFSAYVWRGITYTNRFVIQPDASLTVPIRQASLTAGLWANIEPGQYNGVSDISESGGTTSFDVAEVNWTGEVSIPVTEAVALAVGATGYIYPNSDGLTEADNTVELHGRAEFTAPLSPTAAIYYDVDKIDGAYLEGGISHTVLTKDRLSWSVGLVAGLSAGQHADLDAGGEPQAASFNFNENGFTHADLWTAADIVAGSFTVSPTVHLILTGDEATKASKMELNPGTGLPQPNRTAAKLWFGVTLGWAR